MNLIEEYNKWKRKDKLLVFLVTCAALGLLFAKVLPAFAFIPVLTQIYILGKHAEAIRVKHKMLDNKVDKFSDY